MRKPSKKEISRRVTARLTSGAQHRSATEIMGIARKLRQEQELYYLGIQNMLDSLRYGTGPNWIARAMADIGATAAQPKGQPDE